MSKPQSKKCSKCNELKPVEEFNLNKLKKDGRQHYCRPCQSAKDKESKERLQNTPCSVCKTAPRVKGQTRCSDCKKASMAKSRYGIDREQYEEIFADPACACCGRTPEEIGGKNPMHIDHCHEGGQFRGLLCRYCNNAIGMLQEDVTRARQVGAYLLKHKYDVVTTQEHKTTPDRRVSGLVMQLP